MQSEHTLEMHLQLELGFPSLREQCRLSCAISLSVHAKHFRAPRARTVIHALTFRHENNNNYNMSVYRFKPLGRRADSLYESIFSIGEYQYLWPHKTKANMYGT